MSVTHSWLGPARGEVALDEVGGEGVGPDPLPLAPPGNALQTAAAHQQRDLVVPDFDATSHGELGVDPEDAVSTAGLGVDLGDQVAQQRMPDRALRWGAFAVLVEP